VGSETWEPRQYSDEVQDTESAKVIMREIDMNKSCTFPQTLCIESARLSDPRESIHDLGHCVDRDVEHLSDQLDIIDGDILVRDIGQRNRKPSKSLRRRKSRTMRTNHTS
jgi:hypothetical protein